MGAHIDNESGVRGRACEFIHTGHTYIGNAAEG